MAPAHQLNVSQFYSSIFPQNLHEIIRMVFFFITYELQLTRYISFNGTVDSSVFFIWGKILILHIKSVLLLLSALILIIYRNFSLEGQLRARNKYVDR